MEHAGKGQVLHSNNDKTRLVQHRAGMTEAAEDKHTYLF